VVIVASILLAFAIDAAWEYRQHREAESELVAALTREFSANRETLLATISRVELAQHRIDRLVGLSSAEAGGLPPDTAWTLLDATWIPNTYELSNGVVTSALSSGTLALIGQASLREAVAGWPGRVDDIRERAGVMLSAQELVEAHVDRIAGSHGLMINNPMHSARLLGLVRADGAAMAQVSRKQFLAGVYAVQMRELLIRLESTLATLEAVG
jgi:hypothetical protein